MVTKQQPAGPTEQIPPEGGDFERFPLGTLFFLTGIFWLNFSARVVLSPLMPTMERQLGISHTAAGSLFLYISVGYFAGIFLSSFISARLTHRKTIILSALAGGLLLIGTGVSPGLLALRSTLFFLGIGTGIYLPSGIASITDLVKRQHWGKALAIHELAPNLSFIATPLLSELLLVWMSWRGVLVVYGIATLASGLLFAVYGRGGRLSGEPPGLESFKTLLAEPSFWIMAVLFSLAVGSTMGLFTMLPLYLVVEHGIGRNLANTMVSLSRVPGIGMVFLAGWARDRFGSKRTLVSVFILGGILTILLGLPSRNAVLVLVMIQPWIAGCFFPVGFAALSSIASPSVRSVALSLALPLSAVVGSGITPTWIGFMGDKGSFGLGISVVGGFFLLGALLPRFLHIESEAGRHA